MTPRIAWALIAFAVGCEATGGGGTSSSTGTGVKVAESGTKRGSAGGFAATLGQELGAPEGSLGAAAPGAVVAPAAGSATASPTTTAGSAATAAAGSATTAAAAGSAAATPAGAPPAGAVAAKGASTPAPTPAGTPAGAATKPAAGSAAMPAASPAGAAPVGAASTGAQAATPAAPTPPAPSAAKMAKRVYVKPPADIAAIKFDLEPNWERDVGEAGTFSLVVNVPNSEDKRVFAVRYGYDDQSAPFDCDQYRKFLEDKKVMTVTVNRQRSGACYVEGTDKGVVSFRYMINYGGKRLMCQGSLYKDAASASLGDLRDKVLMQAKKICETLAL